MKFSQLISKAAFLFLFGFSYCIRESLNIEFTNGRLL